MFWLSDPDGAEPAFYLDPILLRPRSRGTVRLRSADPTDPPRIDLPGLREPSDVDRLVEGYERGLELANHPAIRRACSDPAPSAPTTPAAWRERVLENAYSIPHVVGTCAMGPVDGDGAVVNVDGQVHGVAGLLVADASIMPEPPDGFPHLVTLMLAEHLSARLADRGGRRSG
jgi:choline dehydrogenase